MFRELQQNYFELFSLPQQFTLDRVKLDSRFREFQLNYHPDRFANGSDQERRVAMQCISMINEAYSVLQKPRLRAKHLLELEGVQFNDERETSNDVAFLMRQMEFREEIEDAGDSFAALNDIAVSLQQELLILENDFVHDFEGHNLMSAKQKVLGMRFFERLVENVESRIEQHFA